VVTALRGNSDRSRYKGVAWRLDGDRHDTPPAGTRRKQHWLQMTTDGKQKWETRLGNFNSFDAGRALAESRQLGIEAPQFLPAAMSATSFAFAAQAASRKPRSVPVET
jgi:hypothetical protein